MPEQFEVMGNDDVLTISVTKFKGPKPYYGGYRHPEERAASVITQARRARRGLIPERNDVDRLKHRDTQTYEVKTRSVQVGVRKRARKGDERLGGDSQMRARVRARAGGASRPARGAGLVLFGSRARLRARA